MAGKGKNLLFYNPVLQYADQLSGIHMKYFSRFEAKNLVPSIFQR